MLNKTTRREMLRNTTLAGFSVWVAGRSASAIAKSPNEKLNVACIGVGGRGAANVNSVARQGENIVALCDVDEERAAGAFERFPKAQKYHDFRRMLDEMEQQIDAVVVSTPDHTHAAPSVMAMRMGKHVYCEKPLAHNVYEARLMAQVAAENKVATQLGTQHHARSTHRRVVELIQSGAIGRVRSACASHESKKAGNEGWGIRRPKI
jgi:predicted dehydrogenase